MDLEAVWKRARADLVIPTPRGDSDVFLWEHSARAPQTAQQIAGLPPIRSQRPDELAIIAAALYHDAGWIMRFREGAADRIEILVGSLSEADYEQGALLMERTLAGLVPKDSLELAARAVRSCGDRASKLLQAQVGA